MNKASNGDLAATLSGLATGLRVRHITTTDPVTFDRSDDFDARLREPALQHFDQFPVQDGGVIVGVVTRSTESSGTVPAQYRPIDARMLVSADEPLQTFIPTTINQPFRLVVDGSGIAGIVTKSDIQKMPARIHAFTLISHLESSMTELIEQLYPNDTWLSQIGPNVRVEIRKRHRRASSDRIDSSMIEFSTFTHKMHVLEEGFDENFKLALEQIREVRNVIAHGRTFAGTIEELIQFVETLALTQSWIDKIEDRYREVV